MQIRAKLRQIGDNMLNVTWVGCFQLSIASTGIASALLAILGFVQGVFKSDAFWLIVTLLQATIIVAIVILAFTLLLKLAAFIFGSILVWITKERRITREARILVASFPVGNEYFVAVHNDEFWFSADNVTASSKFRLYLNEQPIGGNFLWNENGSKDGVSSIPRKTTATLHIATKENDKFVIHFVGEDVIFPIPNEIKPFYKIDVTISGTMTLLGYKLNRIKLIKSKIISFYNDGVVQLD